MTVSNETVKQIYPGDDANTTFAIPFAFIDTTVIAVYLRVDATGVETLQTLTTHYTLTGSGPDNVEMVTPPAATESLVIIRESPITQPDTFSAGAFPAEAIEERLDKICHQVQEAAEQLDRTIRLAAGSSSSDLIFPDPEALRIIQWNAAGDALENGDALDVATITAAVAVNTADIATNLADIAANAALISTNSGDITNNAGAIAANVADIASNVADISANTIAIAAWTDLSADVAQNAADIITNAAAIVVNADAIAALDVRITDAEAAATALALRVTTLENSSDKIRSTGQQRLQNNHGPEEILGASADTAELGKGDALWLNANGATSAKVTIEIYRKDDAEERISTITAIMQFVGSTWYFGVDSEVVLNGNPSGVDFSIDTVGDVGTVSYTTDNMSGGNYDAVTSYIRFLMEEISIIS